MGIELYTVYRFAGKNMAHAVIIPIEIKQDTVRVIYKSVSASIQSKDKNKINKLISNNLINENVKKSLVKQKELNPEKCRKLYEKLQESNGHMVREKWDETISEVLH